MLPIQKLLINANYTKGVVISPKYIIIHESGNSDKGANAIANRNYFANHPEAQASAHFCVDDHSIIQCLETNQRGWHIGVIYGRPVNNPLATNSNTVGIEICVNVDDDFAKARANAIDLTKYLMSVLHISASNVIRHYDACLKDCPQKMLATPSLWADFKARLVNGNTITPSNPVIQKLNLEELFNGMFSEAFYLSKYPDVASAVKAGKITSGKAHYLQNGKKEGRMPCPPLPLDFNEGVYLSSNPDVAKAVTSKDYCCGVEHYMAFGFRENRKYK